MELIKRYRQGLILVVILLFPSIIYFIFSLGEHNVSALGYIGEPTVNDVGDTVYLPVEFPELINAQGESFDPAKLDKVIVLDVFTMPYSDRSVRKGQILANLQEEYQTMTNDLLILSLCIDSAVGLEDLEALSEKHLAQTNLWAFAKSNEELESLIQNTYVQAGVIEDAESIGVPTVLLFDRELRPRAAFDTRMYKETKKMEDAVKMLIQEPFISWKDK